MPLHFFGGGLNPSSLKLSDSGQIPVSMTPTMTSLSAELLATFCVKRIKSHDLVVWSFFSLLGKIDTIPSMPEISLQDLQIISVLKHSENIFSIALDFLTMLKICF